MKAKTFFKLLTMLILIFLATFNQATAVSNSYGVSVGTEANYKVMSNQFFFDSDRLYYQYLLSFFNTSDVPVNAAFNLKTMYNSTNEFTKVLENSIIGTTVIDLPDNNSFGGNLQFNYNNTNTKYTTGFIIGTPIVSTNWSYWTEYMNSLPSYSNSNHTITSQITVNDQNVFNSSFSLEFTYLPENITYDGVVSLAFVTETSYNKTTGILLYENFNLNIKTEIRTLEQNLIIELTTGSPSTKDFVKSSNLNAFGIEIFFPILSVVGIYYLKKRVNKD